MLVEFPARFEDLMRSVSVNPLHVVAVIETGQGSCEVITTARVFYVQLSHREAVARLKASTSLLETS